jgi:hypothetical protein
MAKQTFTTGQVLTAAQMTSLQQTAMLGGAASAKTASYTLVAADAGTAISMSNAGATTITVNTALFAAGDTVHITNLGAGVCTITAGTATVNSSASLALAQYESGFLDFTSTSAAIFVKGAGAAAASGGMTLINTGGTTLTGASVTIGSIPGTYNYLKLIIENFLPATDNTYLTLRVNNDSNANRHKTQTAITGFNQTYNATVWELSIGEDNATSQNIIVLDIYGYANTTTWKLGQATILANAATTATDYNYSIRQFAYNQTGAVTSLVLSPAAGNFTSGTAYLYGVK